MANEPERPIERLLRASAKKRRDEAGAPLELHPATRRLLQGEVVRKHARAGRESRSFFQGLGQLWPRFTWGLALLAVMAVGVYMLLPVPGKGKPPTLLTRNEPTSPAQRAKGPLPPSPAASAARANPSVVASVDKPQPARRSPAPQIAGGPQPLPKDSLVARPSKSFGQPASVASAPAAPALPAPAAKTPAEAGGVAADESAKLAVEMAGQSGFAYKSLPAGASADTREPSAAPTDGLLASAAAVRQEARSVSATQWFAQVAQGLKTKASKADKAMLAHPVLASFQLEQTGRELRVIDGDGSVYSGYLQIAAATRPQRSARTEAAAAPPRPSRALEGVLENEVAARFDSDQPAPQTCYFHVTGTNRSLQKRVVFTGNLLAATNLTLSPPGSVIPGTASSVSGFRPASAQPNLLRLGNSRISGKVVIGSGKAVELNALPTSP